MFEKFDKRVQKLNYIELILVKSSVFFATIFLVKLYPQLLGIKYTVLFLLIIACAVKPMRTFWSKT